ncbi:MAG: PIN domain-containing protein [Thermaerobacter sp.]|nr:PIN domain-containing protein [Thermaerobacter sp.]
MSASGTREFIDTNILVHAFDGSAGAKHHDAAELIRRLWLERTGFLSMLQEFYVTLTHKVTPRVDGQVALGLVRDFSTWAVHAPTAEDEESAIRLHLASQLAFWDAMVIQSAVRLGCSVVWSEDLSHGRHIDGLTIRNPFASH